MKKYLLGAAAVFAVAAPMAAHAETNAVVGLTYANSDFDSFDANTYGLEGAFSHDLDNGWTFQMDGANDRTDVDGCCFGSSYGAAHFGMRNDGYAVAGFAGFENFFSFSGLMLGVEGQLYLGNINLGASVARTDFSDADLESTSLQIDGSYFFTPNLAVNALIGDTEFSAGSSDTDWMTWGAGVEYRFTGSAFSIAGNYRNADLDGGEVDTFSIGLHYDFGTGSLQERSRTGPGLNGASAAHDSFNTLPPLI